MSTFEFSPEQRAAIDAHGRVLLIAAAGSGKTGVLVERIVNAVVNERVPFRAIAAVTFTEKAAQGMRQRLAERLAQLERYDEISDIETAAIGTIHGLCGSILRSYGTRIGVDPGFAVLDAGVGSQLANQAVVTAISELEASEPATIAILSRYYSRIFPFQKQSYLSALSEIATHHPDRELVFPDTRDGEALQVLFQRAQRIFRRSKIALNSLDYDDMQQYVYQLVQYDDIVTTLRTQYQRVLVDEFQDTNTVQAAIVNALGGDQLFAVGDEWQSIYRFRKADIAVFREQESQMPVKYLHDNYRSAAEIINVVNYGFSKVFSERYTPVHAQRSDGLRDVDSNRVEFVHVRTDGKEGSLHESIVVADRISALIDSGVPAGDIAVLFAARTHVPVLEAQLTANGVKTVSAKTTGYFQQGQVADVVALLRWAANNHDDTAACAVLASPYVGMGWEDLYRVTRGEGSIFSMIIDDDDPLSQRAVTLLDSIVTVSRNESIATVVHTAVHAYDNVERILNRANGRQKYANARKIIEMAGDSSARGTQTLDEFLQLVDRQMASNSVGEAAVADEHTGAVQLMTIHQAKGLEFPHVFIFSTSGRGGYSKPQVAADHDGVVAYETPAGEHGTWETGETISQFQQQDKQEDLEEEYRKLYVAFTRAESSVVISAHHSLKKGDGLPSLQRPAAWLAPTFDVQVDALEGRYSHATLPLSYTICRVPEARLQLARSMADHGEGAATDEAAIATGVALFQEELAQLNDMALYVSAREVQVASGSALRNRHHESTQEIVGDESGVTPAARLAEPVPEDDQVVDNEGAKLRGTALHRVLQHALIRSVDHVTEDDPVAAGLTSQQRTTINAMLQSEFFAQLLAAGARPEVPWYSTQPDGTIVSGRFDALVVEPDGWWIIDYKSTLPESADEAFAQHAEQLERYRNAAREAGITNVRFTLVAVNRPDEPYTVSSGVPPVPTLF